MTQRDDDAKKAILARRAKFVAAAIAGIGIACGKEPSKPLVCLSVEPTTVPDAQPTATADPPDAEPMPCLKIAVPPEDAGSPRACLRVAPPKDKK